MRRLAALFLTAILLGGCAPGSRSARLHPKPVVSDIPMESSGATVALKAHGAQILPAVLDLIGGARRTVDVEMYEFGHGQILNAILAAARRGVQVRVLLDATEKQSQVTAEALQKVGPPVHVRFYQVTGGIDHIKLLVADGKSVLIGGMNWGKGSMNNHDYDVLIRQAPGEFPALFARDWAVAGGAGADAPDSRYLVFDDRFRSVLLGHLREAATTVYVEMNILSDNEVIKALSAARARGVDVRVLLDPTGQGNRDSAEQLLDHQVQVRWFYTDKGRLHAKAAVVDGVHTFIGSANWTHQGLSVNHEAGVHLHVQDIAIQFGTMFGKDWDDGIPVHS